MLGNQPNFDTALPSRGGEDSVRVCQRCNMMLDEEFTIVHGKPACAYCTTILKGQKKDPSGSSTAQIAARKQDSNATSEGGGMPLALAYGFASSLFSATAYAAIVIATQFEIGFFAVGMGWAVGSAVRKGNGRAAGTGLRVAALAFVYLALVLAYTGIGVHSVYNSADTSTAPYRELLDQTLARLGSAGAGTAITVVLVSVLAMTLLFPLTGGLFGLLFLAIGMHQAWSTAGKRDPDEDFAAVRDRVG